MGFDLTPASSIEEYFRGVLQDALSAEGVDVTESTEWYLVSLLGEFAHNTIPSGPLGFKLAQTDESGAERVATLKEVGDTSLYVTGFFADSLERGLVASDYYVTIGESAYRELSTRLSASSVSVVYEELAAKFPRFVDVLAKIRGQVSFGGGDVAELYAEWLKTRSEWVERRLRQMGMIVVPDDEGTLQ